MKYIGGVGGDITVVTVVLPAEIYHTPLKYVIPPGNIRLYQH